MYEILYNPDNVTAIGVKYEENAPCVWQKEHQFYTGGFFGFFKKLVTIPAGWIYAYIDANGDVTLPLNTEFHTSLRENTDIRYRIDSSDKNSPRLIRKAFIVIKFNVKNSYFYYYFDSNEEMDKYIEEFNKRTNYKFEIVKMKFSK